MNRGSLVRRYAVTAVVLGTGVVLALGAFFMIQSGERERVRADFVREAERRGAAVERALADGLDVVEGIRDLYASTDVTQEEFRRFVRRPLAANRAVREVLWAPEVSAADRAVWERGAAGAPRSVTERDGQGRLVPAPLRDAYLPIERREPAGLRPPGYDLASEAPLRAAFQRATTTDTGIALVEEAGSLLVVLPVHRAPIAQGTVANRRGLVRGYVVGRLGVTEAIELADMDTESHTVRVAFRRPSASPASEALAWRRAATFAGEDWMLEVTADRAYAAARATGRAGWFLGGSLAVLGALAWSLTAATRRRHGAATAAAELAAETERRRRVDLVTGRLVTLGAELVTTIDPDRIREQAVAAVAELCGGSAMLHPADVAEAAETTPAIVQAIAERRLVHDSGAGLTALPLIAHDVVLGALSLQTPVSRPLPDDTVQLLTGFADQVALALANAENQRRASDRSEKLAALSALTQLIASTMTSSTVFNAIARSAVTLLGADLARVWVADRSARVLRIAGRFGLDSATELGLTDHSEIAFGRGIVGRVYESGEPLYVADMQADGTVLNRRLATEAGLRAIAAVPLVTAGIVLGTLAIVFRSARPFTMEEREVIGLLAGQAAIAIDNTRLLEVADQRRRDAEALADFGRTLARSLHRDAVARVTAERLRVVLDAQTSAVYGVADGLVGAQPLAAVGRLEAGVARYGALVAQAAMTLAGPVVVTDVMGDTRIDAPSELRRRAAASVATVLALPLSGQDALVATLAVSEATARRFRDDEIAEAQAYVDRAALALYNARLYEESQTQLRRAEALAAVGAAVGGLRDETEIVRRATRAIVRLFDADMGATWILAPDGDCLLPLAGYRLSPEITGALLALEPPPGRQLFEEMRDQDRTGAWSDSAAEERFRGRAWSQVIGHRSLMLVPLRHAGRLVGAITVAWRNGRRDFTAAEIELVDTMAGQLTISLENFRLVEQLRGRQNRLETLLEINRQLAVIQPTDSLLQRIAEACGRLLDAGSVGFRVVEGDELVVAGAHGDARAAMPTERLRIGESLSGCIAATGEPLIVNDLLEDPRLIAAHRTAIAPLGYTAFLGVPVKLGDRLLGVLSARTKRAAGFDDEDLAIATAFASQAASAIENARLYREAQRATEEMAAAQEQLVAAQKMDAIGRLAGGIAHDFNNLLTVITGRANLLKQDLPAGDPALRHADLIQTTAKRAGALTKQLLAFSRRQVLQPRVLQLNRIVESMSAMLRPLIGEHNDLVLTLHPHAPCVKVDPTQLEQVVMNLVVNARDAMPKGGLIGISTECVDVPPAIQTEGGDVPPGRFIRLAVRDAGVGMDADTRAHLFEPFFTTKELGKGTGLGLATVYGIVKQSGGHIGVQSAPGLGTVVEVFLPAVALSDDGPEADAPEPGRGGHETILVVEDEEPVRELLCEILESRGYTVLGARDGLDALRVWQEHSATIDLVITDVVMPRMNGPEFVQQVTGTRADIPVLYVSGYNADLSVEDATTLRSTGRLLEKPFSPQTLAARVRAALDRRAAPAPA